MENNLQLEEYLSKFGNVSKLNRRILLNEMDNAWDNLGLDNTKPLLEQSEKVGEFYGHYVWVLNGLYSELDPVSRNHRIAIANYLRKIVPRRVADYGGGSGVLARFIAENIPNTYIDIIEPFPSDFFRKRVENICNVQFVPDLSSSYDVLIAQDVLEHVDDPIGLTLKLISAVGENGYLIFANCFYPDIKCHLPSTFYLRHQFREVVTHAGLKYITPVPGATHALVFQKVGEIDNLAVSKANQKAKTIGSIVNGFSAILYRIKRVLKKYANF